jgi:uncharacterized membrane-anchored protein YitT (DUF2179 family)
MIVQQAAAYQPLTIGDWIVIRIILAIPLAGLVMLFVWALSSDTHPSKKTYCQSTLVIVGCALALVVVMGIVFGGFAAIMAYISQQQGTHHQ